jgi:hypothetical protein
MPLDTTLCAAAPSCRRAMRIALLFLASIIRAPTTDAQAAGWSGAIEANANILFGAAQGRLVALRAGTQRADSTLELEADVLFSYADTRTEDDGREVTARATRVSLGTDYRPRDRVSPFWFGSVESSLQQRLARRYTTGAGAKLTMYREGDDDVSVSLALLWEQARTLDPEPPAPRTETQARWSLRVRARRQLTETTRLEHVTFYQPAVAHLARSIAESTTSLAVSILARVALTTTLRDRYDSEARQRGARSNHDGQLLFGVRASF